MSQRALFPFFRNRISNGLWPTSIYNLVFTTGILSISLIGNWAFVQPINYYLWRLAEILHLHEGENIDPFGEELTKVLYTKMGKEKYRNMYVNKKYYIQVSGDYFCNCAESLCAGS